MYRKLSTVRIAPRHSNQRHESQDVSLQKYSIFLATSDQGRRDEMSGFCKAIASKAAAFQALDTTLDAF